MLRAIHHQVYSCVMARTNIDIDDELVAQVMQRYHLESKRGAVDFALRNLVLEPLTRDELLAMRGSGIEFDNDEVERGWEAAR